MQGSDPFAAPSAESTSPHRLPIWPWVRFAVRRLLLVGFIPFAIGTVAASVGGFMGLLVGWAIPLALWIPSTLMQLKVLMATSPADPRAVELADGRVLSRRDFSLWTFARAWESVTVALMLPVMAIGLWPFSPTLAITFGAGIAFVPIVLARYQWLGIQAGRGIVHLASEEAEKAEALLRPVARARFVAPTARRMLVMLHARALARLGRIEESLELLDLDDHTGSQASTLAAQIRLGHGELDPARTLLEEGPLPPGFSGELSKAFLGGLLHIHANEPERLLEAAEAWQPLLPRLSQHTARFLDTLHAIALSQLARDGESRQVLYRRDAHTDDWPWLATLYPHIAALRDELLER